MMNKIMPYLWLAYLLGWCFWLWAPAVDLLFGTNIIGDLVNYWQITLGFCKN